MNQFNKLAQSQQASIQNLERQVGHQAKAVIERISEKLPNSTKMNPKETTMAVTLCSSKVLDDPVIKPNTKSSEQQDRNGIVIESEETGDSKNGSCEKTQVEVNQCMTVPELKAYVLPIPFPQRFKKKGN